LPLCSPRKRSEILLRLNATAKIQEKALKGSELDWQEWLAKYFPHVATMPFADRHIRLWSWFDALKPGHQPPPQIEIWPRGGAKSSTAELGVVRACVKLSRRFVLYVSGTQEKQANPHVQTIGAHLERIGVQRGMNNYGNSRGWTINLLRTENGFNVAALGLDAASRGVKLDQYRPDLIILDDIDDAGDSRATVEKKVRILTTSILPTGSPDCAILGIQNKIRSDGIFGLLQSGEADFLHNRRPVFMEPAVQGLKVEPEQREDGGKFYRIVAGQATWAGQSIAVAEKQINEWGLGAFLREAQHEVEGADGIFFKVSAMVRIAPEDVPPLVSVCLAGDLAATENGGDHTVLVLLGKAANGTYYVPAVIRGQWGSDKVRQVIMLACDYYLPKYPKAILHLPQDPGQAGKDQKLQMSRTFAQWHPRIEPVSGPKATRATGFQEAVNLGNVYLVDADLPECLRPYCSSLSFLAWQNAFRSVLRDFKADEADQEDDDVDAGSDAFNELTGKRERKTETWRGRSGGFA
jgi:phage terminase large subunit-like protein